MERGDSQGTVDRVTIDQRMADAGFFGSQIASWHRNRIADRDPALSRNTAIHEAGHVVLAHDNGIFVSGVAILGYSSGPDRGITVYSASDFAKSPIAAYVSFCCAGLMAEMLFEVSTESTRHLAEADYRRARNMLRCIYPDYGLDKLIDDYNALALQHLRDRREAVQSIALALEQERFLDHEQIARLIPAI